MKLGKYSFAREQKQAKSIKSEELIEEYDFHRLKKVKQDADSSLRRDTKKDRRFKKTLREPLHIGGLVYVSAERVKKKDTPGKVNISTIENTPFSDKNPFFIVRKRVKIKEGKYYCWILKRNNK